MGVHAPEMLGPHRALPPGTGGEAGSVGVPTLAAAWPVWSAPVAVMAAFAGVAFAPAAVEAVAGVFGVQVTAAHTPAGVSLATEAMREGCVLLSVVSVAWWFTRSQRATERAAPSRTVDWTTALIGIAGVLVLVYAFDAVLGGVFGTRHLRTPFTPIGPVGSVPFLLDVLITIGLAPVCEELLFRGYVFPALCRWRGWLPAALITGVGFGALHLPVYTVLACVPLAVFGVGLCALYRYTGSVVPCMVAHSLNNAAAYAAGDHLVALERGIILIAGPVLVLGLMRLLSRSGTVRLLAGATPPASAPVAHFLPTA
jgi:membrane protease YdiL (CAAX protease family)